jgi:hypothetical protein
MGHWHDKGLSGRGFAMRGRLKRVGSTLPVLGWVGTVSTDRFRCATVREAGGMDVRLLYV